MKTIRELRTEREMTQLELANEASVTPGTVYKWEAGDIVPDIRRLRAIARIFGVMIEDISLVGVDVDRAGNPIEEAPKSKIAA